MDLQSIFYILAIFFLILGIIAMSGVVAIVIFLYIKLLELHGMLMDKIAYLEYMKNHPQDLVKTAALGIIRRVAKKATDYLQEGQDED